MLTQGMFINDRYEIIDKVGSGGMADVYKAKCHRLNRFVAIKVLKPEYSDDKNFVNKFRGEAQSAAGLSHPNIVNVYDVGDDNGLHYIVMELVEGITLKKFIERKGKLEIKEAVGIAIQIALGMEAAHTNHIIHRDIKPQNIIISREGKVKVTDFGIAKATTSNTITSNAMGSVHYLSPEQARGGYSDEKSDIYSLGVTLYEMLSGQVPFAGDNTVSVALLHIQGEATPLRQIDPTIPMSVEKIVQKCMQKKPERRYLSASELIADLKRSISNPNGDFVVIPAAVVSDSPTITISEEEVNHIKNASKASAAGYENPKDNIQNTDTRRKNIEPKQPVKEEDEELDSVDPRLEKIAIAGTIAVGVVILILIVFIVSKVFNIFPSGSDKNTKENTVEASISPSPAETADATAEPVILPNVEGLSLEDAQNELLEKSPDLNPTWTEEASDTVEKGIVISQYPKKGAEVDPDAEVKLVISTGPESIKVPNVYNLTDKQAVTKLEEAGLVVKHDYDYSDEIEEGRVISTTPARETAVVKGDSVTILVSNGPENTEVTVPDLIGSTKVKAKKKLVDAGLALGEVKTNYSDTYAAGQVMEQSYDAGTKIAKGTTVNITVSLGSDNAKNSYVSQLTISENPFDYSGESGIVWLKLEQDGKISTIKKVEMNYDSFPLQVTDIKSTSGSDGTVHMFVAKASDSNEDASTAPFVEYGTSWAIKFTPE